MSVRIEQIAQCIEQFAPKTWAEEWDNVGLLVGGGANTVDKVLMALDGTMPVVEEAKRLGAQLIIAHHPIIFRPLKNLRTDNKNAVVPIELLQSGIGYYAAHTNLDQSVFSSAMMLAKALELKNVDYMTASAESLVKLAVFVPPDYVEELRTALAKVGVGAGITDGDKSESYSDCFFQTAGEGMFRALEGANPAVGRVGALNRVEEVKLESIVPEALAERAVRALRRAHPYEEPAFDLIPLQNRGKRRGYGAIGYVDKPMSLKEFDSFFKATLSNDGAALYPRSDYRLSGIRIAGEEDMKVRKIGIANGSGNSFVGKALALGVDLLITGELDYHSLLDGLAGGMAVCEMGHFLSEVPMLGGLQNYLSSDSTLQEVDFIISSVEQAPW